MCAGQFLTKIADVNVDDAIEGAELAAEHGFSELFAGDDVTSIAQQRFQQRELNAGHSELNIIHPCFASR